MTTTRTSLCCCRAKLKVVPTSTTAVWKQQWWQEMSIVIHQKCTFHRLGTLLKARSFSTQYFPAHQPMYCFQKCQIQPAHTDRNYSLDLMEAFFSLALKGDVSVRDKEKSVTTNTKMGCWDEGAWAWEHNLSGFIIAQSARLHGYKDDAPSCACTSSWGLSLCTDHGAILGMLLLNPHPQNTR